MDRGGQEAARFFIILFANLPMGVCGFGDAVVMHIALTICSMNFPGVCSSTISEAVYNLTVGGLAAMAVQSALIWREVNWQLVRLLLWPILFGTGLGLVALYHVHSLWLKRVLGLVFLSVGAYQIPAEVLRAKGLSGEHDGKQGQVLVEGEERAGLRRLGRVLGLASGFLAGLFGTGGPPLMILVAATGVEKDEWRASNAVIWLVDNVFRLLYLQAVQRQISLPDDASRLLLLMLAGGLGVGAGSALSSFVDVALFRRLLILLMLLGANVMLFAGRPLRTAVVGVCAVSLFFLLYLLALWRQPSGPGPWASLLAAAGLAAESSSVDNWVPQRWMGKSGYSRVATQAEEEREEGRGGDGNGKPRQGPALENRDDNDARMEHRRKPEIEMMAV